MVKGKPTLLVVDDEPLNLELLKSFLKDEGYEVICANNGLEGWSMLEQSYDRFDAVLLDRMMPEMNGMEVLKRIKSHPSMSKLPVIMQTGKTKSSEVLEGLEAGIYYYLTKPLQKTHLLVIVNAAVRDYQGRRFIEEEVIRKKGAISQLDRGEFSFHTIDEAKNIATLLSSVTNNSDDIALGLLELLINAVEHGNLGISYDEKSELIEKCRWEHEVERRLNLPENKGKRATLKFERLDNKLTLLIEDQGKGFDWEQYLEMKAERAFDSHGRGIAMAKALSFDSLEYLGCGNQVMVTHLL